MILKRLKLKNFRGYTDIVVDFDSNMNVIIGKNDVGKSTILEALEIFFNSEKIKIDISDLSVLILNQSLRLLVVLMLEMEEYLLMQLIIQLVKMNFF